MSLVFAAGEAFQFDWGEDWALLGGRKTKLQVAHAKLSHSRTLIGWAYLLQSHDKGSTDPVDRRDSLHGRELRRAS